MAALSRDAHRRRVLEHQAKVEADRSKPVPASVPASSDPQLEIRLIGEVRSSDETVEQKRAPQSGDFFRSSWQRSGEAISRRRPIRPPEWNDLLTNCLTCYAIITAGGRDPCYTASDGSCIPVILNSIKLAAPALRLGRPPFAKRH